MYFSSSSHAHTRPHIHRAINANIKTLMPWKMPKNCWKIKGHFRFHLIRLFACIYICICRCMCLRACGNVHMCVCVHLYFVLLIFKARIRTFIAIGFIYLKGSESKLILYLLVWKARTKMKKQRRNFHMHAKQNSWTKNFLSKDALGEI